MGMPPMIKCLVDYCECLDRSGRELNGSGPGNICDKALFGCEADHSFPMRSHAIGEWDNHYSGVVRAVVRIEIISLGDP